MWNFPLTHGGKFKNYMFNPYSNFSTTWTNQGEVRKLQKTTWFISLLGSFTGNLDLPKDTSQWLLKYWKKWQESSIKSLNLDFFHIQSMQIFWFFSTSDFDIQIFWLGKGLETARGIHPLKLVMIVDYVQIRKEQYSNLECYN